MPEGYFYVFLKVIEEFILRLGLGKTSNLILFYMGKYVEI